MSDPHLNSRQINMKNQSSQPKKICTHGCGAVGGLEKKFQEKPPWASIAAGGHLLAARLALLREQLERRGTCR
jgi:hypothetical protein